MHADFIVYFTGDHPTWWPNDPSRPPGKEIRVHLALSAAKKAFFLPVQPQPATTGT
jgi:hypothetical protein